jgi:hypothetical protein
MRMPCSHEIVQKALVTAPSLSRASRNEACGSGDRHDDLMTGKAHNLILGTPPTIQLTDVDLSDSVLVPDPDTGPPWWCGPGKTTTRHGYTLYVPQVKEKKRQIFPNFRCMWGQTCSALDIRIKCSRLCRVNAHRTAKTGRSTPLRVSRHPGQQGPEGQPAGPCVRTSRESGTWPQEPQRRLITKNTLP